VAAAPKPLATSKDDLGLVLPVLIPEAERKHLLNLAHARTQGYRGSGSVRAELRHLRDIGLIRKLSDRHIGDLKSGSTHDLARIVELTDLGRHWVAKLDES
jgi:hypothetical protein